MKHINRHFKPTATYSRCTLPLKISHVSGTRLCFLIGVVALLSNTAWLLPAQKRESWTTAPKAQPRPILLDRLQLLLSCPDQAGPGHVGSDAHTTADMGSEAFE